MRAVAKTICVLPRPYGYLRKGQVVELEIAEWDVKKFPWLKHLDAPAAAKAEKSTEPPKDPKDPKDPKADPKGKGKDEFLK